MPLSPLQRYIATWTARHRRDAGQDAVLALRFPRPPWPNGLPYSIGAAVGHPGRQVVCVVGDGGLTMLMGEIETLVQYKLRVTVIIIKNNVLGQIKWEQMILKAIRIWSTAEAHRFREGGGSVWRPRLYYRPAEDAERILRQASAITVPPSCRQWSDLTNLQSPGKVTTEQAHNFAKSLVRGQKDAAKILETVAEDQEPRDV